MEINIRQVDKMNVFTARERKWQVLRDCFKSTRK